MGPSQHDKDWGLFKEGNISILLQQKRASCSRAGIDFILKLLRIDPEKRLTVEDALKHEWLTDPKIVPVLAPKMLSRAEHTQEVESDTKNSTSCDNAQGYTCPIVTNGQHNLPRKVDSRTTTETDNIPCASHTTSVNVQRVGNCERGENTETDVRGLGRVVATDPPMPGHFSSHMPLHQFRGPSTSPRTQRRRSPLGRRQRHPLHPMSMVVTAHSPAPTRLLPPVSGPSSAVCGPHVPVRTASPNQKPAMANGVALALPLTKTPIRRLSPYRKVISCSPVHRSSENLHQHSRPHTSRTRQSPLLPLRLSDSSPLSNSGAVLRTLKAQSMDSGDQAKLCRWAFCGDNKSTSVVSDHHEGMRRASPLPSPLMGSVPPALKMSATTSRLHNVNGRPARTSGDRLSTGGVFFPRSISPGSDTSRQASPAELSPKPATPRLIRSVSPVRVGGTAFQWHQMPLSGTSNAGRMPMAANITRMPSPPHVKSGAVGGAMSGSCFDWSPNTPKPGRPSRSLSPTSLKLSNTASTVHLPGVLAPSCGNFISRIPLSRVTGSRVFPKWPA